MRMCLMRVKVKIFWRENFLYFHKIYYTGLDDVDDDLKCSRDVNSSSN